MHFQSERADVWSNNLHAWQLRFETLGVIRDVERLRRLFDLFCAVLDALVAMGSAAAPIAPSETMPDAARTS